MSDLPKGWVKVSLGQILELKYGKSLPAKVRTGQGVPVYGSNGVVGFHSDALIFQSGLIVGRKGSFGVVHRCDEPFFPIDTTYFIDEFYDQPISYWYHFLRYLPLTAMNRSTAIPGLNREDAYGLEFGLPPLNEQFRIADKLDLMLAKVDAAQARLDKIPNILKRFRQSVLAAATSGELTKEWRGDIVEREITDKYSAPKSWDLFIFEKLIDVVTSGSRGWAKYYSDQGSTFIRAQNINSDSLNLSDIAYVSLPEKAEGRRTKVEKDNLLITITGANVTKAARVSEKLPDAYVSQHVALVKLKNNDLSPFLELFIKANNSGRGQLLELAYGGGKPGLNLQNIKGLKVALPSIEEQKEIVRRVESLFNMADTVEKKYKDAKARTNRLTQSILAKAFRGELVPQEPSDEPASILLEKIKAERAANTIKNKPKATKRKSKGI